LDAVEVKVCVGVEVDDLVFLTVPVIVKVPLIVCVRGGVLVDDMETLEVLDCA
jgi:hypothetical protein